MPALGILFDIEQLGSALYGHAAYKILFEAVDTRWIPACLLSDGDTAATLAGRENRYCIAIESADASALEIVRTAVGQSSAPGLLPADARFVGDAQVRREPLVRAARIDAAGRVVDCKTGWLIAAWEQCRGKHPAVAAPRPVASAGVPADAPPAWTPPPIAGTAAPPPALRELSFPALFDRKRFGLNLWVGAGSVAAALTAEFTWILPELLYGNHVELNSAGYYAGQVVAALLNAGLLVLVLHGIRRPGLLVVTWGAVSAGFSVGWRIAMSSLMSWGPPSPAPWLSWIAAGFVGGALVVAMLILAVRFWQATLRAFLAAGAVSFVLSTVFTLVLFQRTIPGFQPHWDNSLLALANGLLLGALLYAGVARHLRPFGWQRVTGLSPGYFECVAPSGDGLCSDNGCPCHDTIIPRGSGFLYISPDVVGHRGRARTTAQAQALAQQLQNEMARRLGSGGGVFASFNNILVPVLMCEQGARRRDLDLAVAAADARHWWETGQVPLRATPAARRVR